MKNVMRQNKMLIAATLFSDIPPVVDPLRRPNSAKALSGGGKAKREVPRGISSPGAVYPTKCLALVSTDPGVLSPTGYSPMDVFKRSSREGTSSASGRCSINTLNHASPLQTWVSDIYGIRAPARVIRVTCRTWNCVAQRTDPTESTKAPC